MRLLKFGSLLWGRCCLGILLLFVVGCSGSDSPTPTTPPSGLSYEAPVNYYVGLTIDTLLPTLSGTADAYSVSPPLPAGLVLDPIYGWITGTPTVATPSASYTIRAANGAGETSYALTLTVEPAASVIRLEPMQGTTIGVGQTLPLHLAYWSLSTDTYPVYIDAIQVTWSSSQSTVASVGSDGTVTGLAEGSTLITASYLSMSRDIPIVVGGSFTARNVSVTGQGVRQYSVFTPSGAIPAAGWPVILSLHGGGGSAVNQASTSLLNALAESQKVLLVYLEGSGVIQTFNAGSCCGYAQSNNIDDVAYANAVVDDLIARDDIDTTRIHATGFSNGGMMSHRLACAMADRLAGMAAIGGASADYDLDLNQYYVCSPTRPIPILHVHAKNDRNYPFEGGVGSGLSTTNYYPVASSIADWIARNNVTSVASIEYLSPTTMCERYAQTADNSKPSASVTLCTIDPTDIYDAVNDIVFGGGHSWPTGNRSSAAGSDYPVQDFNVDAYIWSYFGN